MQSVSIATKVVSSNPVHGEVYSIQHYGITFDSGWRQVGGFLQVPRFPINEVYVRYGNRALLRMSLLKQDVLTLPEHPVLLEYMLS
jgi:hypothetical protein